MSTSAKDPYVDLAERIFIALSSRVYGTLASSEAKKPDPKGYKGLRQFSMMVCKKVEEKGTTSYNEVADELVAQIREEQQLPPPPPPVAGGATTPATKGTPGFDEKTLRRRRPLLPAKKLPQKAMGTLA